MWGGTATQDLKQSIYSVGYCFKFIAALIFLSCFALQFGHSHSLIDNEKSPCFFSPQQEHILELA